MAVVYSALISLIFLLMLISLPLGPYIVFHLDVGDRISPDFPLAYVDEMLAGAGLGRSGLEVGDMFIAVWAVYVVLIAVAMLGPKRNLAEFVLSTISRGDMSRGGSYAADIVKWFSIIVVISAAASLVQEWVGIATEPPAAEDDLLLFVSVSSSPILEELGFRVLLIGVPLYLAYSHRMSLGHFLRSLWRPATNLHPDDYRRAVWLIAGVSVLFGLAHVLLGEPWTAGKFAQATAAGMVIGWLYVKRGLLVAILIHWATNYFIFAYAYFVAYFAELPIEDTFYHPLMSSLEMIFLAAGTISIAVMLLERYRAAWQRTKPR